MKKLGLYLAIALAGSLFALSCNEDSHVKYFRHLYMHKVRDLDFTYPVDPKDYKKINCYAVKYDDKGRIIGAVFLKEGKPAMDGYYGLSSIEIQYSENNEKWYLKDIEGKTINKFVEYQSFDLDSTGRLLSCTNYSEDGEIVEDSVGIAKYIYDVDSLNNIISLLRIDFFGDTTMNYKRQYKDVYKYDSRGNLIEVANFDENNELLPDLDSVAIIRLGYNKKNEIIDIGYYDDLNKRTINKDYEISRIVRNYDLNGNINFEKCLDENDKLIFNDSLGFAYYEIKYDESGNKIREAYYDNYDNPTIIYKFKKSGALEEKTVYATYRPLKGYEDEEYSYYTVKYEDDGDCLEFSTYNSDGSPYVLGGGYTTIKDIYDKKGNIIEKEFYSADGNLTEDKITGIATYKFKYDNHNHNIEMTKYDVEGKLKNAIDDGVAIYRSKYDDMGNQIEISFHGADGSLKIPNDFDFARGVTLFDDQNRLIGLSNYGENNELVISREGGCAFSKIEYDGDDFSKRVSFYDTDSSLIESGIYGSAYWEEDVDDKGEIIEDRYFDADSNLISKSTR